MYSARVLLTLFNTLPEGIRFSNLPVIILPQSASTDGLGLLLCRPSTYLFKSTSLGGNSAALWRFPSNLFEVDSHVESVSQHYLHHRG
jgi:hypothetical protein